MKKIVLLLLILVLVSSSLDAQETRHARRKAREKAKIEEVRQLIGNRDLRFIAQTALPMGGSPIHLTSEYTLDIEADKVISFLPYFGIAYSAEYGGGEGGIKFSEIARKITWKESKKGFEIVLEVRSPKDLYIMHLSVQPTGYATLDVSSNNRQFINFSGIVEKRKTD
jgi:hypothetical protein